MDNMAKISIAIPYHDTPKTAFFLSRLLQSIATQTFKDYEIVLSKEGAMAHNHNAAIKKSNGELIKIMQMDDYFAHPAALQNIVDNFSPDDHWMISACEHTKDDEGTFNPHFPTWNDKIYTGNNTLGGFSTVTIRNEGRLLLEESLTWVVDCDWYQRYYLKYGMPKLLNSLDVVVDVGTHRLSSTLTDELKLSEVEYLTKKYE